jgi:hypothetical protein
MKRVPIVIGVVLFVALSGIIVQRELTLSDRVGALSDRVGQLERERSGLLAEVSELRKEVSWVRSTLQSEIQAREELEADLVEWTDAANQLFGYLMNKPSPGTEGSGTIHPDNNPCGPGSLGPYPNEDGELTCW